MKVALAQWQIGSPARFDDFAARVEEAVAQAAAHGARLLVLPEYLAMELAHLFGPAVYADVPRSLEAVDALYPAWRALFAEQARRHALYLVAGTFLKREADGRYRNRALLCAPDGTVAEQDKLCLTGYEKDAAVIAPGEVLRVFDTELGRVGINICYDSEFPLYARAQAEAGAALLLVPSCTDTEAGASRVRIGCQARALENQLPVLCAVTAGESDWSPLLDTNTGRAAVYVQPDHGLPADGVLARHGEHPGWLFAELDVAAMRAVRAEGQVGVAADWDGQLRPDLLRARRGAFVAP
ncbi:carbon-nitrogen hydrolase family protein [Frateuria defendens]|uniref:carbon-nitrogen hydrolase family protein n=1 Tax=Frateuria defendens TaxID=2219559 RepID=UPI00066FE06E|nr:carbon-nitrogen hydrolase family protein [Frateuria defendens]